MKKNVVALFLVTAMLAIMTPVATFAQERERRRTVTSTSTSTSTTATSRDDSFDRDYPEKDEFHQSYSLASGAKVDVQGINGSVTIETIPGGTAEVHIVRSARNRDDLEYRKILVEHTSMNLTVRPEKDNESRGRNRDVRQRVLLRIPRQVDLGVSGVNGQVGVGEIDGPVQLSGINGRVEVAQAMGYSHISGINGRVKITLTHLGEKGIHVSGVNGGVELFFSEDLNADLDVTGINGSVNTDVSNVTVFGKIDRQNFHAKIGSGGSPIKVTGINGHVKLSRAGSPG